ncbi:hypothetical protein F5Y01DRAFT_276994 [Xylaria sp. FL0043]|nr:hypothetical protein F5Y01DRAFT_276994 [Xylaria sp. FL0043]
MVLARLGQFAIMMSPHFSQLGSIGNNSPSSPTVWISLHVCLIVSISCQGLACTWIMCEICPVPWFIFLLIFPLLLALGLFRLSASPQASRSLGTLFLYSI